MKLVTYLQEGRELVGVLTPDAAMVCPLTAFGYACTDMREAIGLLSREEVQKLSGRAPDPHGRGYEGHFHDLHRQG